MNKPTHNPNRTIYSILGEAERLATGWENDQFVNPGCVTALQTLVTELSELTVRTPSDLKAQADVVSALALVERDARPRDLMQELMDSVEKARLERVRKQSERSSGF